VLVLLLLPLMLLLLLLLLLLLCSQGLGKTLQGITLMWTLLQQGAPSLGGVPIATRAIIVCPTSLVSNWASECDKWLKGRCRCVLAGPGGHVRPWCAGVVLAAAAVLAVVVILTAQVCLMSGGWGL
jgi:hypothetical protein